MNLGSIEAFTVLYGDRLKEVEPILDTPPFTTQLGEYAEAEDTVPVRRPYRPRCLKPTAEVGQLFHAIERVSIQDDGGKLLSPSGKTVFLPYC
jgi:hypothetical protein